MFHSTSLLILSFMTSARYSRIPVTGKAPKDLVNSVEKNTAYSRSGSRSGWSNPSWGSHHLRGCSIAAAIEKQDDLKSAGFTSNIIEEVLVVL